MVAPVLASYLNHMLNNPQRVQELALFISFILEGSIARAGLESSSEKVLAAKRMVQSMLEQEVSS